MSLTEGSPAPAFTLPDQEGTQHSLEEYRGQWLVLYFYPKDDTPGCTKEACGFRDSMQEFGQRDAVVFGVSRDSVESHAAFASKFSVPFSLLSDEDGAVCEAYGTWRERMLYGKKGMGVARVTFLIDPDGTIVKIYEGVKPDEHAAEVIADIDAFNS